MVNPDIDSPNRTRFSPATSKTSSYYGSDSFSESTKFKLKRLYKSNCFICHERRATLKNLIERGDSQVSDDGPIVSDMISNDWKRCLMVPSRSHRLYFKLRSRPMRYHYTETAKVIFFLNSMTHRLYIYLQIYNSSSISNWTIRRNENRQREQVFFFLNRPDKHCIQRIFLAARNNFRRGGRWYVPANPFG